MTQGCRYDYVLTFKFLTDTPEVRIEAKTLKELAAKSGVGITELQNTLKNKNRRGFAAKIMSIEKERRIRTPAE
jgi:hypothetical protein